MTEDKEIRDVLKEERHKEKSGKYKPLPRNRRTERAIARIFENGTADELMRFLRENGLQDESPRFAEIVKLFHEHGRRRR